MQKLYKPCPFCGETEGIECHIPEDGHFHLHVIRCMNCGAQGEECRTPEQAKRMWNTRSIRTLRKTVIETLKAAQSKT